MSVPAVPDDTRNSRLPTALFRVGMACAPVAALVLLIADSNGLLRVAAVLAILAVALIGLSIALRPDGGAQVGELRDEIERLRHELHGEITAAAQRGNQALDQTQRTQEAVVALGRRLDAGVAAPADTGGAQRAWAPVDVPAGRATVPDIDHRGDQESDWSRAGDPLPRAHSPGGPSVAGTAGIPGAAGAYAAFRPSAGAAGAGDRFAGQPGTEWGAGTYGGTAGTYGGADGGAWSPEPDGRHAAPLPGAVRHTQAVHAPRHTVVDSGRSHSEAPAGNHDQRWPSDPDTPSWPEGGERSSWPGAGARERHSWRGVDDSVDRSWSDRGGWARDDRGLGEPPEVAQAGAQWDGQGWANQPDGRGGEWSDRGGVNQHAGGLAAAGDAEGEYWSQPWAGSEPAVRSALPPASAEWGPPRQRQPEPRWQSERQPEPGRYGRGDDNRWR